MKRPTSSAPYRKGKEMEHDMEQRKKISSKGFKEPQFRSVVYKEEERKKERLGYRAVG
jgi:hypothetical protein